MSDLDKQIKELIKEVPKTILGNLLREKLIAAGKNPDDSTIEKIVNHIYISNDDTLNIDDGTDEDTHINFTDEDIKELGKRTDVFIKEKLPEILKNTVEEVSKKLFLTLKKNWKYQRTHQEINEFSFTKNLENRWEKSLTSLRMMLTISREIGEEKHEKFARSKSKKNVKKKEVMLRLHGRACQTMSEIERLLSGGYADGALARWRTLHEVYIISNIIFNNGENLSERYLDHEIVEDRKALKFYEASHKLLGYPPPTPSYIKSLEEHYSKTIDKYGIDFKNEYGWASPISNKASPNFSDLEKIAGHETMRSHYKMASYMVHAGVKGIRFKLGLIDDQELILAGASNAGLEEAGQNSILTLGKMTIDLLGVDSKVDDLVKIQLITKLMDEGTSNFIQAARKLKREVRNL